MGQHDIGDTNWWLGHLLMYSSCISSHIDLLFTYRTHTWERAFPKLAGSYSSFLPEALCPSLLTVFRPFWFLSMSPALHKDWKFSNQLEILLCASNLNRGAQKLHKIQDCLGISFKKCGAQKLGSNFRSFWNQINKVMHNVNEFPGEKDVQYLLIWWGKKVHNADQFGGWYTHPCWSTTSGEKQACSSCYEDCHKNANLDFYTCN